jgi:uncharacterized membrane protein YwzB
MDLQKDNNDLYIQLQTIQIDKLLNNNNYQGAFILLVITLPKLNEKDRNNFIQYYHDYVFIKHSELKLPLNLH